MALNDPDALITLEVWQLISSIMRSWRCSTIKQVLMRRNEKMLVQTLVYDPLVIGYYRH